MREYVHGRGTGTGIESANGTERGKESVIYERRRPINAKGWVTCTQSCHHLFHASLRMGHPMWATRIPKQVTSLFFGGLILMSSYSFRYQVPRFLTQMYITLLHRRRMNKHMAIRTLTLILTRTNISTYTATIRLTLPRIYVDRLHSHLTAQE
jgi:hypothetical protein